MKVDQTTNTVTRVRPLNLTPTWAQALNICLALLEAGNAEGKAGARKELQNMAALADKYVEMQTMN